MGATNFKRARSGSRILAQKPVSASVAPFLQFCKKSLDELRRYFVDVNFKQAQQHHLDWPGRSRIATNRERTKRKQDEHSICVGARPDDGMWRRTSRVCGAPASMHVSASDCLPHFVRARSVTLGRIWWPVAISRKRKCAKRRTFGGNGSSWVLWCAAGIRSRRCIICIGSNPDKKKYK